MEIKEYITEVVDNIFGAITELQKMHCKGREILPPIVSPGAISEHNTCKDGYGTHAINRIDFDIAVEVSEQNTSNKKGGASIKVMNVNINRDYESKTSAVQRVSFSLNVAYPSIRTEEVK